MFDYAIKLAVTDAECDGRAYVHYKFYQRFGFCFDDGKKNVVLGTHNTELRMIYNR